MLLGIVACKVGKRYIEVRKDNWNGEWFMSKRNVNGLKEYGAHRTEEARNKVLETLNHMRKDGTVITVAGVARRAGVSPNFIYSHDELKKTIRKYYPASGRKTIQSQDSKDALINSLNMEMKALKKQISNFEKNEKYKEKYEKSLEEIEQLKKEIENLIQDNLDIDY